jgi:hypothetical protein
MFIEIMYGLFSSGVFLHTSYILLIFFLFLDKRKSHLFVEKLLEKNITTDDTVDKLRSEIKLLHSEILLLIKENHSLSIEIKHLGKAE